jgi:hypothetical protein
MILDLKEARSVPRKPINNLTNCNDLKILYQDGLLLDSFNFGSVGHE